MESARQACMQDIQLHSLAQGIARQELTGLSDACGIPADCLTSCAPDVEAYIGQPGKVLHLRDKGSCMAVDVF